MSIEAAIYCLDYAHLINFIREYRVTRVERQAV